MTINRKIWLGPFFEDEITKWPCPRCGKGHLLLVENTFKYSQLVDSRPNSEDWSPELSEYAYTTMLRCTNNSCNENFASCGSGYVTELPEQDEMSGELFLAPKRVFEPEYFYPPLDIFPILRDYPESVANEIRMSFRTFYCDPATSANHVRKCVENMLTTKRVKRVQINAHNKKQGFITLHKRLDLYKAKDEINSERLRAIKWLGNEGSHSGKHGLTRSDILDAYDILEIVLDDFYVGDRKSVDKKVSLISKYYRLKPVALVSG